MYLTTGFILEAELTTDFLKSARLMPRLTAYALLGWTEKTGDAKRNMRQAPDFIKIGKQIFFTYDAIEAFMRDAGSVVPMEQSNARNAVLKSMLEGRA